MTYEQTAEIFTAPSDVERLKGWVRSLAINAKVRVRLRDGSSVTGIVAITPTVQVFRNPAGDEGINGSVKLEDPQQPGWDGLVWLGDIVDIEHLDSVTMGATKA